MTLPDLTGRVAVITGASRGLGAGMAADFLSRGMKLALMARGPIPDLPQGEVLKAAFDVRDRAAMADFAKETEQRFGAIDLWINNAAVLDPVQKARDLTEEELRLSLDINIGGVLWGSQVFARHVESRPGDGVLLNISSGASTRGVAGWAAYCMAKAAVDRLTETLQLEEAAHGLRCWSVAPGIIDTGMQQQIRDSSPDVFPDVAQFHQYKKMDLFNTEAHVGEQLLRIAFDPTAQPEAVAARIPAEKS